jgi:hypothetical protein
VRLGAVTLHRVAGVKFEEYKGTACHEGRHVTVVISAGLDGFEGWIRVGTSTPAVDAVKIAHVWGGTVDDTLSMLERGWAEHVAALSLLLREEAQS